MTLATTSKMQQTIAANKRKFDDWLGTQGVSSRNLDGKPKICWDGFLYLFLERISLIKKRIFFYYLVMSTGRAHCGGHDEAGFRQKA